MTSRRFRVRRRTSDPELRLLALLEERLAAAVERGEIEVVGVSDDGRLVYQGVPRDDEP